jgi:hypothetical protein
MNNIDLEHSGVMGMHWGRRKTSDTKTSTTKQHVSTVGKKIGKSGNAKPQPYTRPPNMAPKRLTDAQLRTRINRIEMEKKFALLTAKQVSPARKMITEILSAAVKKTATDYVTKMMAKGMDNFTTPRPTPSATP